MKRIATDTLSLLVLALAIGALEVRPPSSPPSRLDRGSEADSARLPAPFGAIATSDGEPFSLCILLDTSGSMAGEGKLDAALLDVERIIGALGPRDDVALVAYANTASVAMPWTQAAMARREPPNLRGLRAGGATNLSAAMRLGGSLLADSSKRRHLLILSDGAPNRGVTTSEGLLAQTRELVADGVRVSAIGLGILRDQGLLARIAFTGTGTYGSASIAGQADVPDLEELIASFRL
jgi:Ca-activated chloride channel homolog